MAPGVELAEIWRTIPEGTELRIVHGPAEGVLDMTVDGRHVGSVFAWTA